MWVSAGILQGACMRAISLPKHVLVVLLGCMVLTGCGTQEATTDHTPAGSAVSATTPPDAPPNGDDPEMRFLALTTRVTQGCAPDTPHGAGSGGVPGPEDLSGAPAPAYGPGETPPGVPSAEGDIPVPVPDPAPSKPTPGSAGPMSVEAVPLTAIEKCSGNEHAQRIGEAFTNTTTGYQAMHKTLTGLDYPASRVHRMPDHAGAPRARLDLRMMGSHLALEVTRTTSGVIVEAFGAPETEDVKVTDVRRKPEPDAPAS